MKLLQAEAGVNDGKAGLLSAAGLFSKAGVFDKKSESFNILELDPYLLFDARESMLGTLENPTLDLDPATPSTLDVITATRSGTATYTDANGNIATAAADTVRVDYTQGEELTPTKYQRVGYTDFSQDWTLEGSTLPESQTTAPDGTTPVYELTENTGTSRHRLFLTGISLVVGQDYTVSAYVKKVSSGRFFLINSSALNGIKGFLNLDTGVATLTSGTGTIAVTDEGNGWYRLSVTAQATTTNGFVYMQLQNAQTDVNYTGTGASMLIWGPQLEEGTTASDFVANTTGSPKFLSSAVYSDRVPMILVEPSSENLWGWSEGTLNDYQTNAVLVGETYLSDDATSRNGLNSWLYFQPSSDTQVGFRMPVSVTSGSTMILSFYVIMDDGSKPRVGTSSTGSDTDFAILLQGISSAGVAGGVEHISGDLYRVWAYRVFTGTSNAQYIYRYATHSGKGFKISGVMLEESSVPTSYIPTSGSTVTRQADDLEITGSDFDFYNQSEGTVYVESELQRATGPSFVPFLFDADNGDANRVLLYYEPGGITGLVRAAGTQNVIDIGTHPAANTLSRTAFSYKSNNLQGSKDGNSVTPVTTATIPTSINRFNVGSHYTKADSYYFNGHLKRLIYWPVSSDSL